MNSADDRMSKTGGSRAITLYRSPSHECAYLPEREAVTQFIDPAFPLSPLTYSHLVDVGFRRSGEYVYRPRCNDCQACMAARIPVTRFNPSRGQRRIWRANQDVVVNALPAAFKEEHFALYRRYIRVRHPGGGMDAPDPDRYREFLLSSWCNTLCFEFRLHDRLLAVAVADRLQCGLSAVYTFFDPEYAKRGLGTYAVLWEIAEARRQGLNWVYLGYWIAACRKMNYKCHFRPLEIFRDGLWQTLVTPVA